MKGSIVRSVLLFAAGAACAGVVAGVSSREPIEPAQYEERLRAWLVEGAELARYTGYAWRGHIGVNGDPYACAPPPQPKLPMYAVNPWDLEIMLEVAQQANRGYLVGNSSVVRGTDRCWEDPPM